MPLYLVSVKLRRSALTEVVREFSDRDLERVYQKLYFACQKKYESKLEHFDCIEFRFKLLTWSASPKI